MFICWVRSPKLEQANVRKKEADSAIFLDIPPKRKNMADNNNNSYVWSDVETEVFLDLI